MKIVGIYLAAGNSSRMGIHKLVAACWDNDSRELGA